MPKRRPLINQRCREVGCPVTLMGTTDYDRERLIVQHGPNPEHVKILTLDDPDWAGMVRAWVDRIHAPA
jgi:hypothetical protein